MVGVCNYRAYSTLTQLLVQVRTSVKSADSAGREVFTEVWETVASCAGGWRFVESAASGVRESLKWRNDERVADLTWSKGWVSSFLQFFNMSDRVTARTEKIRPSTSDYRAWLGGVRAAILVVLLAGGIVCNIDETSVIANVGATSVLSDGVGRTAGSIGTDSNAIRMTALIGLTVDRDRPPPFLIITASPTDPTDFSGCRVVKNCGGDLGFAEQELWEGDVAGVHHKRPWVRRASDGAVISCQKKAWMDEVCVPVWGSVSAHCVDSFTHCLTQVAFKMYIDLVWTPWIKGKPGPHLLLMDNVATHKTADVQEMFRAIGTQLMYFLPNTTDIVQASAALRTCDFRTL